MGERIHGVGLDDVFRDADGRLFKVVGICSHPTVIIEAVDGESLPREELEELAMQAERRTLTIGAPQFDEYLHLVPKESQ